MSTRNIKIGLSEKDKLNMKNEIYDKVSSEVDKGLKVSGTDTASNILAFTENKGIYVATDTGGWYYWKADVSKYVYGGTYQATEIADGSITPKKTSFIETNVIYENKLIEIVCNNENYKSESIYIDNVTEGEVYTLCVNSVNGIYEGIPAVYIRSLDINGNQLNYVETTETINSKVSITVPANATKLRILLYATREEKYTGIAQFNNVVCFKGTEREVVLKDYVKLAKNSVTEEVLNKDLKSKISNITNVEAIENIGEVVHNFINYEYDYKPNSIVVDKTYKGLWSKNALKLNYPSGTQNIKLYNVNLKMKTNDNLSIFFKISREDINKINNIIIQAQTLNETITIFNQHQLALLEGWNCNKIAIEKDLEVVNLILTINANDNVSIIFDTIKNNFRLKPKVLLCFDNDQEFTSEENKLVLVDGFKPLLEERGFKGTFALQSGDYPEMYSDTITYNSFWNMIGNGWDFAYYNGEGKRPSEETLNDSAYLEYWKSFINNYRDKLEEKGIFNPFSYFARFNKTSTNINATLKENGTKMIRMANSLKTITYFDKESFEIPCVSATDNIGYSFTLDNLKEKIDQCITNGECICILCHALEDVEPSAVSSSSYCSKNGYIELLDYIKNYVNNNQLEVVTFREFYSSFYPKEAYELDNGRSIKRSYYIEKKINNL